MLRDDIELYSKLTGEDGAHVPIIKIGAYLDGYIRGRNEVVNELTEMVRNNGYPEDLEEVIYKYLESKGVKI